MVLLGKERRVRTLGTKSNGGEGQSERDMTANIVCF